MDMSPSQPQASDDVENFLNTMQTFAKRRGAVPRLTNERDISLWRAAWAALSVGASPNAAPACLTILLRLPASSSVAPTPMEVLKVVAAVARHAKQSAHQTRAVIHSLELVVDVVKRRLIGRPSDGLSCLQIIEDVRMSGHAALMAVVGNTSLAQRASCLMSEMFAVLQRYATELGRTEETTVAEIDATNDANISWNGWQSPTLAWLLRGTWLGPPPLVTAYDNVQCYADTLREMVTMLTFYWGAGAVFPKCHVKSQDDRYCDQPLCVPIRNNTRQKCSIRVAGRQSCDVTPAWRCFRHGHSAMCTGCMRRSQKSLIGAPGSRASTDIYDAVIERETFRKGGVVYIASQLSSRKPPSIPPNWRTTYRLNCSALVGVVRLASSCEPLRPSAAIAWAEVVPVFPQGGTGNDHVERSRGRLAFRLLNRSDLSTLQHDAETPHVGQRVALIDLQVFVPEVVSVLSALTDPGLVENLRNIRFIRKLIQKDDVLDGEGHGYRDDQAGAIRNALETTEIDVVDRLPAHIKERLIQDIISLALEANLYGTQLDAFAAALSKSLHCTHGPPGSGKSYLGVVLIRALDRIRHAAMQAGQSIGPIVVLSYKNHALDEILIDLIESERTMTGIIRCGKAEDARLDSFTERRSPFEQTAQSNLIARVTCLRAVRRFVRDMRSVCSAFSDATGLTLREWTPTQSGQGKGAKAVVVMIVQTLRLYLAVINCEEDQNASDAYSVLEDTVCPSADLDVIERRRMLETIQGLDSEMEHWVTEGNCRVQFLLKKWITGAEPPPRCAAAKEDGCVMPSKAQNAYCELLHKCLHPNDCSERRLNGLKHCRDHSCCFKGDLCDRPRIMNSTVCERHACKLCIAAGCQEVLPRVGSACEEHTCREQGCVREFISSILPFCILHTCRLCRFLETRDTVKVKSVRRIEGSFFCVEHKCTVKGCDKYRPQLETAQNFCARHACIACEGTRQRIDTRCPKSQLCETHRCSHHTPELPPCSEQVMEKSVFCPDHTCLFCREESALVTRPVVDLPPRNTCVIHSLCTFVLPDGQVCCERTSQKSNEFCEGHLKRDSRRRQMSNGLGAKMQCSGIANKSKQRCKATGLSTREHFYCRAHLDQQPDSESEPENIDEDGESENESETSDKMSASNDEHIMDVDFIIPSNDVASSSALELFQNANVLTKHLETVGIEDVDGSDEVKARKGQEVVPSENTEASMTVDHPLKLECEMHFQNNIRKGKQQNGDNESSGHKANDVEPFEEADALPLSDSETREAERLAFGICPDELDITGDLDDEEAEIGEELPENLQRLHDIVGDDSTAGSDSDQGSSCAEIEFNGDLWSSSAADLREWIWDIPILQRYRLVANFFGGACAQLTKLAAIADAHVEAARQELAEAASFTFKRARVIGATVVGATRRLQSLRASEPFAMIVEEACEVMEPTLVSVLSVRSLQKLEMIGDHRQLPAFVQPCWFALQNTHPSIQISLFERLVQHDTSLVTILDVQRRMRPEISDLTRCEYKDVVQIVDDECTKLQRVADRVIKLELAEFKQERASRLEALRRLWSGEGKVVPGIVPQVFFWNIETREGRAAVGMSRCNYGEAEACIALARWLLHCGVPARSITIITPFKGQKLTISKMLQKTSDSKVKSVFVSTVDRYQGDENDIIILSLVSTRPGNRFVALRNRFIVSTSRARLGFYIVGSSGAVTKTAQGGEGPLHWRRLLLDLGQQNHTGDEEHKDAGTEIISRVGPTLTICCPRHEATTRDVTDPGDFPQSEKDLTAFCAEQCKFVLPWCEHRCQLQCHAPHKAHTSACPTALERPCESHADVPLKCHEVLALAPSSKSLGDALQIFKCDVPVQFRRLDCSHVVTLPCFKRTDLQDGLFKLSDCTEQVADFVHPSCGHRFPKPTCVFRRKWEGAPPLCMKIVTHRRACGCQTEMSCYDSVKELSLDKPPPCLEAVLKPRPRCGHELSSRCYEANVLRELWSEQEGEAVVGAPPTVMHGVQYGPSETELATSHSNRLIKVFPLCRVETKYQRRCGHELIVSCTDAFSLASGVQREHACTEIVSAISPLCGHEVQVFCHLKEALISPESTVFTQQMDSITCLRERTVDENVLLTLGELDPVVKKIHRRCSGSFSVVRKCGHKTSKIPCSKLFSLLISKRIPVCMTEVEAERSCGHSFMIPCCRRSDPPPVCNHPVDDLFVYPFCQYKHSTRPGTCTALWQLKAAEYPRCPVMILSTRYRCSHNVHVPCHLEYNVSAEKPGHRLIPGSEHLVEADTDYCVPAIGVSDCVEPVVFKRRCGHEDQNVPCQRAFEWAESPETAGLCHVLERVDSPLCGHSVEIECHLKDRILDSDPWGGTLPMRITTALDGEDDLTSPVIVQEKNVPKWSSILESLKCGHKTLLQRVCGHEDNIPCESLFEALRAKCEHLQEIVCENCGYERLIPCHDLAEEKTFLCLNLVERTCSECKINSTRVECYKERAFCESEVSATGPCGHSIKWLCGEKDPRLKPEDYKCVSCLRDRWAEKLDRARVMTEMVENEETTWPKLLTQVDDPPEFSADVLMAALRERGRTSLPTSVITGYEQIGEFPFRALLSSYCDILESQMDILSKMISNNESMDVLPKEPPNLSDASECYDIVYTILRPQQTPEESLKMVDTQYGLGTRATVLSVENLRKENEKDEAKGNFSICVAAAFRHEGVDDFEPFRPPAIELRRLKGRKTRNAAIRKANSKARRLMQDFLRRGYDYICRKQEPAERVYWKPGTVFPLLKAEIRLTVTCMICFDEILPIKGWRCPHSHTLCRECFNNHVQEAMKPGSLQRTVDGEGNVLCPQDNCGVKYEPLSLLNQEHDASQEELRRIFDNLQELRMTARSQKDTTEALEQQKLQLQAEFQHIQNIKDLDERKAETLRMEIIEEILTLRCPVKNCRAAFLDFDGCFALTCSNTNCRIHFCAWCIHFHSNADIHNHVAHCPEAEADGYFHPKQVFEAHHRRRAKRLVLQKLGQESLDVQKRTLKRIKMELRDLAIEIHEADLMG